MVRISIRYYVSMVRISIRYYVSIVRISVCGMHVYTVSPVMHMIIFDTICLYAIVYMIPLCHVCGTHVCMASYIWYPYVMSAVPMFVCHRLYGTLVSCLCMFIRCHIHVHAVAYACRPLLYARLPVQCR